MHMYVYNLYLHVLRFIFKYLLSYFVSSLKAISIPGLLTYRAKSWGRGLCFRRFSQFENKNILLDKFDPINEIRINVLHYSAYFLTHSLCSDCIKT